MADPDPTSLQKNFFQRHVPLFYDAITYLAAPLFPNADLRNQLVKETIQREALDREIASLRYDNGRASEDAWRANQERIQEHARAELYLKQRDNFKEQNRESFERWQTAYQALEEATGLQLEEAHVETAIYQRRCLELEERLRDIPTLKTLQQTLQLLERDRKLNDLLFPSSSDEFEFLSAAIQIYTPTQDEPIEQDIRKAFEKILTDSPYCNSAAFRLAEDLAERNFPQTAKSLYQIILDSPCVEIETRHDILFRIQPNSIEHTNALRELTEKKNTPHDWYILAHHLLTTQDNHKLPQQNKKNDELEYIKWCLYKALETKNPEIITKTIQLANTFQQTNPLYATLLFNELVKADPTNQEIQSYFNKTEPKK